MLREISSEPGSNPLKEQQSDVIHSVNQELLRLESLRHDCTVASDELSRILEKLDKAKSDIDASTKIVAEVKLEIKDVYAEKDDAVKEFNESTGQLHTLEASIELLKGEAADTVNQAQIKADSIVASAQEKEREINHAIELKQLEADALIREFNSKSNTLDRIVSDIQSQSLILRKLNQSIVDGKRDLANLINTVAGQESHLSIIQRDVAQAKSLESELLEKIKLANQSLADITELVNKKKADENEIDQRLITVTKREVQVKQLGEKIKDLYEKSGVPIDLEL